jgi:hypothetical protein
MGIRGIHVGRSLERTHQITKRTVTPTSHHTSPTLEDELSDPLLEQLHRIESLCQAMGFLVFKGCVFTQEATDLLWDVDRDADPEHFLALAKELGVRLMYIDAPVFSEELIEQAVNEAEPHDQRLIAGYRAHVSLVTYVDVSFLHDQLFHRFRVVPDWYQSFLEFTEAVEEE